MQSVRENAFGEEDIAVLQTIAHQLAVAIENARLFTELQTALEEMDVTQRRYRGLAWAEYVLAGVVGGYQQKGGQVVPLEDDQDLPGVLEAVTEQRPVITSDDDGLGRVGETPAGVEDSALGASVDSNGDSVEPSPETPSVLAVPIVLRDQPIGVLGFKATEGRRWSAENIALAETVAEQFALAADNLRLLDETNRRAASERLISEVTARIRETLDTETVLKTAVTEVRQALGLPELVVRLTAPPTDETGNR
jgi:GAF domain-containing protein